MKHKGQVGADIYIEDSPGHVESLRKAGCYVICFGNPTNRGISAPRAESWEQVYELVKARAAEVEPNSMAIELERSTRDISAHASVRSPAERERRLP
jgi:5' nucleotidase, deoxy (Pyrimidine), cytosolic type C protein (NT5C)